MDNLQGSDLQRMRPFYMFEGILLILFGIFALMVPGITTLSFTLSIGLLMFVVGLMQGFRTFRDRSHHGFWPSLLSSITFAIVGILLIAWPGLGMMTLTLILTSFFLIEGIAKVFMGVQFRHYQQWFWLLLSGILSLLLAFIVIQGWPGTALWLLGTLLGIYLIFFGVTLIMLAIETPNLTNRPQT